jgi:hypothetical protein
MFKETTKNKKKKEVLELFLSDNSISCWKLTIWGAEAVMLASKVSAGSILSFEDVTINSDDNGGSVGPESIVTVLMNSRGGLCFHAGQISSLFYDALAPRAYRPFGPFVHFETIVVEGQFLFRIGHNKPL